MLHFNNSNFIITLLLTYAFRGYHNLYGNQQHEPQLVLRNLTYFWILHEYFMNNPSIRIVVPLMITSIAFAYDENRFSGLQLNHWSKIILEPFVVHIYPLKIIFSRIDFVNITPS